ncbi:MAG: SgcJ/EcaC family oxidoreductase, partial [bacterium]
NQDAKAMGASYIEDGCLVDPLGTEARGQKAAEELLSKTVTTFLKNSTTSFTIEHIRFLKPDVVFVDGTQNVTGAISPNGTEMPAMRFHVVATLIKKGGSWWFVDARPYQFITLPTDMTEKTQ